MAEKSNDQVRQRHGDFIWYELMTGDVETAKAFYGPLLGWTFEPHEGSGMDYWTFKASDTNVGGFMSLSEEMISGGARPMWVSYLLVDDVDRMAAAVTDHGGQVFMPPTDVPTVGRIAMVADPQGAALYVMKPQPPEGADSGPSQSFAAYQPAKGHCAWNELVTADPEAAKRWYGQLFGFTQMDAIDMGPMGEYAIMHNAGQDFAFGAVMAKPEEIPASMWIYYFRVPDIDTASQFVTANGGQIVNGPMDIPGGEFVLNGLDPQGALFALIGPRQE